MTSIKVTPGNSTDQSLQAVIQKIRIICEEIRPDNDMSRTDLKNLKSSLLQLTTSPCVSPEEVVKAQSVLDFMILPSMEDCLELWFGKSKETDERIWREFSEDVAKASMGMYQHWSYAVEEPKMIVALVIYLDQFRRNMFRGTKGMYTCDKMCAGYVKRAMKEGIHKSLPPKQLIFLLLVLTHSEEVEDQRLCYREYLALESKLDPEDPLCCFNGIFKKHLDVVEKYGRFPHRNCIHERANTPEEDEFLLDGAFRFDLPVRKNASGAITFARDGKQLWKILKSSRRRNSFEDIAKEAMRKKNYLSLFGENHQEEVKFVYDENENEVFEPASSLRIGDTAPDFRASSTKGQIHFGDEFLRSDDGSGSWCVMLFHPTDFSPVCSTDLGQAAKLQGQFSEKNVKLLAVAIDSLSSHSAWVGDIEKAYGHSVDFPIVCDDNTQISSMYGMVSQSNISIRQNSKSFNTVRSVFIINPRREVASILTYPVQIGRNFNEILRAVDALQRNEKYDVLTPANWVPGDEVIVPPLYSDEEAIEKFGDLHKKTDHIRLTSDLNLAMSRGKDDDTKVVHEEMDDAEDSETDNGYKEFLAFMNS